ncbi:MAG: glycosyltransferase family 2 protein, partial [Candidatus Heimdallarchaeota archaeon]|nr:glycosyltransferase family 2 protein [Candidatus Heimdallarchaeota archaeon]
MKLSVALIVRDEEKMLAGCLDSVKEADEIVVVDTGSEDRTVAIAKAWTDKVFTDYKWEDHFAKARNYAMSKCTGDWILTIDADDRLVKGDMAKLRSVIEANPNKLCFLVDYIALNSGKKHQLPVLYKRCKEIFWKGAAHNYLSKIGEVHSGATIMFGYSP